jgi:hypothetical protein
MSVHNNRGKTVVLRELGFADPVKMITSSPAILGYAIDNIRGRSLTCASSASQTR